MAAEGEYESILCVKPDVNVYRIPPRASNRAYRAADWKLDTPDWSGRMRITAKGKVAYVKLEDKVSGELYAQAPIREYPGVAVETVSDSSRYFVLRIQDDNGKKRDKPRPQGTGGFGLLPPPPGGKIAPPPSSGLSNHNIVPQTGGIATGCLLELDSSNSNTVVQSNPSLDLWGDFSAPASSVPAPSRPENTTNWIQF
ncbi:hypothetical protein PAMP_008455 [Pampus punctatissimus]